MPVCTFTPLEGKTFGWWSYTLGGITYRWNEGARVNPGNVAMLSVRAQWVGQYTVTFNANGGTVTPETMVTNGSGRLASWPIAIRSGYRFVCWSTGDDEAQQVSLGRVYTADATLNAIWEKVESVQEMHRLYNPNSGEHFYTADVAERDNVIAAGWSYEGVGWIAPLTSSTPVYRLYNPYVGDHHYTVDASERDNLISLGWNDENIGWYSDDAETVPLYRQYNPYAVTGTHNYTTSKEENDHLVSLGWIAEGIAWYGV